MNRPSPHHARRSTPPAALGVAAALALAAGCAKGAPESGTRPLAEVRTVTLPGDRTRLDYQDVDVAARRLYIAHLGDSAVHVVDLDHDDVTTTIPAIASVHGVRVAPELHRLFASATGSDELVTIDTTDDRVVARTPTGHYPDGIAYEPATAKVYVSTEHDHAETVVDARTGQRVGEVDLGGEAGNSVTDPSTGTVVVNVQSAGRLAVIDPHRDTVTATIDTPGCDSDHGLLIPPAPHVAYVACEGNARLLAVDLDTHHVTGSYDVGGTPDVLAFDPGLHRLYVAAESGPLCVLDQDGDHLHAVACSAVGDDTHTVAVDPTSHHVYLPLENRDGHPALMVLAPEP